MTTCKINDQSSLEWLYGKDELWKTYVCENFDETFVLSGNRQMYERKEASWYQRADKLLDDLDASSDYTDLDANDYNITKEQLNAAINSYKKNLRVDELNMIKNLVEIMNPNDSFEITTIRGYNQSDWQTVLYKTTGLDDTIITTLSTYYFGKLVEIIVEYDDDQIIVGCMTHDDLWQNTNDGTLKKTLCEEYDLKMKETKFMKSNGVITTIRYDEI